MLTRKYKALSVEPRQRPLEHMGTSLITGGLAGMGLVDFSVAIFILLWTVAPIVDNPNDGPLDTPHYADIFGPRIVVTATWAIGVYHFCMVFKTFLAWSGAGNSIEFF